MVLAAELLHPRGPLRASLFDLEGGALSAFLARLIAAGEAELVGVTLTEPQRDRAVRSYVVWKALDDVLLRLASTPQQVTLADEGSATITAAQLSALRELRDEHRAQVQGVLAAARTSSSTADTGNAVRRVIPTW